MPTSTLRSTLPQAIVLILTALLSTGAQADKFTVNTTADEHDLSTGDGFCETISGKCSLRAALQEASALRGAHHVFVPGGYYPLRLLEIYVNGDIRLEGEAKNPPVISSESAYVAVFDVGPAGSGSHIQNLHINKCAGTGIRVRATSIHLTGVTVSGCQDSGLSLAPAASVHVSDVEIRDNQLTGIYLGNGAKLSGENLRVLRNYSPYYGGGITAFDHTVVDLRHATIQANVGVTGGGIASQSSVILRDSYVVENTSQDIGGGIFFNLQPVAKGRIELHNVLLEGNNAGSIGGGLWICGEAQISDSKVYSNRAEDGGGIYAGCDYPFTLEDSVLRNNVALYSGGGLRGASVGAPMRILRSQFTGNAAGYRGGAINLYDIESLEVLGVTLAENRAVAGAGAFLSSVESFVMGGTTLHSNRATEHGGGLALSQSETQPYVSALIVNSTFSGNTASGQGGNLYVPVLRYPLTLQHATVAEGVAAAGSAIAIPMMNADLILKRSMVGGTQLEQSCVLNHERVQRDDFNLFSHNEDCIGDESPSTDFLDWGGLELEALADNGGTTLTHMPSYGSSSINLVSEGCSGSDQRGLSRDTPTCESGAVEYPGI